MKKTLLRTLLLVILALAFFPATAEQVVTAAETSARDTKEVNHESVEKKRKDYQPASRFVPTEKLRADDAISFPTDI